MKVGNHFFEDVMLHNSQHDPEGCFRNEFVNLFKSLKDKEDCNEY